MKVVLGQGFVGLRDGNLYLFGGWGEVLEIEVSFSLTTYVAPYI
jgi:phage-related holin